jgi:adenylosuccinate synthase
MPLFIVVGGQYGGEGKGHICAGLVIRQKASILVKTGGPNASHTYGKNGKLVRLRMVPSGADLGPSQICFPAGCLIHKPTLFEELKEVSFNGKILIDANAGLVTSDEVQSERNDNFYSIAGSTLTGNNEALALRSQRRLRLAKEDEDLAPYICDVAEHLECQYKKGETIIVEGAQAFGLSNFHGEYPFVTGRDTTISATLSQLGLGHKYIDRSFLVFKTFPTRNAHGNGQLPYEILDKKPHMECLFNEYGGGSYNGGDRARRVGMFDFDIALRAVRANSPDCLVITGLDKLSSTIEHCDVRDHYGTVESFCKRLNHELNVPLGIESWGQYIEDLRYNESAMP